MSETKYASIGDKVYQEKVVQALLQDHDYAEQMLELMTPDFFDQSYLSEIVDALFSYKKKYETWPSADVLKMVAFDKLDDDVVKFQLREFLSTTVKNPLNGDMRYIQDTSLDFCKRQNIKFAMAKAIDMIDSGTYDQIQKVITDSLAKGASSDLGSDYVDTFNSRLEKNVRKPIQTPWSILNREFNGGWERGTLATVIAPTGAGKTHFLCNVSAGAVELGYNAVYISLEIAEYKIGLRHDAYFSGVKINDVASEAQKVESEIKSAVKGRLFIKEFATKTASVQTIRNYLKRLKSLKDFSPDIIVIDYADLLRPSRTYGEKRHELEGTYEELRGLAQEFQAQIVTADQTNRAGLNEEIVSIDKIGEAYSKATVCDLIMTISRRREDKVSHLGRLYIAKSRLGPDGMVYPFMLNGATVKMQIFEQLEADEAMLITGEVNSKNLGSLLKGRFEEKSKKEK